MILIIDNYDSFTYNLVHLIEEQGAATEVARNDALTPAEALARHPQAIVLSPGPCTPDEAGICLDLVRALPEAMPLLGVCLGHQTIGQAFGGTVAGAKAILHGKLSAIRHDGQGLFAGLPSPFLATRYHSLAVTPPSLPAPLRANAWTEDGEIMGLSHRTRPIFGLQFHPEAFASEHGPGLIANFLKHIA